MLFTTLKTHNSKMKKDESRFACHLMTLCVCIKFHKNGLKGFKLYSGDDFVTDGQTPIRTYGWTEYRENKINMSPHTKVRDIIQNKCISRVHCVHFHPLISETFSVYFVDPIAFTLYVGLTSFRDYCFTLRLY